MRPHTHRRELPLGSFGALVKDYLASPEFKGTKPSTQKIYRLILEPLAELHGHKPISFARAPAHQAVVYRAARDTRHGQLLVKVMRVFMKYVVVNFEHYREGQSGS